VGVINGLSIVDISDSTNIQEVAFIKGPNSTWRDIKTWDHYAYVVNEKDSGALIVDLSNLPNNVSTKRCGTFTGHNIYIDEKGYAYVWGYNGTGGAIIADVQSDPMKPEVVGYYNTNYVHDGIARNDTMWTAEIRAGQFAVVNVADKSNNKVLASQSTPNSFTHNVALSGDGKTLFTTDERSGAYVTAYDVSDLSNITEIDRYRIDRSNNVIPHNTFTKNQFLITSYYTDGVTIVDALHPDNLIETGHYDTSPQSGNGFNGCWGVYPYFESDIIVASDIEEGLFVLKPNYTRAAYLEGTVVDSAFHDPVDSVKVAILDTGTFNEQEVAYTGLDGEYKTGVIDSGTYHIRFSSADCTPDSVSAVRSDTVFNVQLKQGVVTIVNDTMAGCGIFKRAPQATVAQRHVSEADPTRLHGQSLPSQRLNSTTQTNLAAGSLCKITEVEEKPDQSAGSQLSVTPTVFQETIHLEYQLKTDQAIQRAQLYVYDARGERWFSQHLDRTAGTIEVGQQWPTGLYFVQLRTPRGYQTVKIVKVN
jgi:choice-of-anchor B domain-containing protein